MHDAVPVQETRCSPFESFFPPGLGVATIDHTPLLREIARVCSASDPVLSVQLPTAMQLVDVAHEMPKRVLVELPSLGLFATFHDVPFQVSMRFRSVELS